MSLSLVDFSIIVQGIVFQSSELNGVKHLRLMANKIYAVVIVNVRKFVSAYKKGIH